MGATLKRRYFLGVVLALSAFLLACGTTCGAAEPTPAPTATTPPANTPAPTDTPRPTDTPVPTNTPRPTNTPVVETVLPTRTPTPQPTPTVNLTQPDLSRPPHAFVGTVKVNGSAPPVGTVVTALIGNNEVASGTVDTTGKYSLIVEGFPGETITFKIGTLTATQTAVTQVGGADIVNLTATGP